MKTIKKFSLHALLGKDVKGGDSLKARALRVENLENRELLSASTLGDAALIADLTSNAAVVANDVQEVAPIDISNAVAEIVVTSTADSGDGSLRAAIESADDGDVISFNVNGAITLSTPITITKNLTITGADSVLDDGSPDVMISGGNKSQIFIVDGATVTFDSIVIANADRIGGQENYAVTVRNGSNVTIENCDVADNVAFSAAIGILSSKLTISGSNIHDNFGNGSAGGAVYAENSTVDVVGSSISGNTSARNGSAIYASSSTVTLVNSLVNNNSGKDMYQGVFYLVANGVVNAYNSTIVENDGGVFSDSNGTLNLYNSILLDKGAEASSNTVLNAYNTLSAYTNWTKSKNAFVYSSNLPLFESGGSYKLSDDSQAVDKGSPDYVQNDVDFFGNARINHNLPDLGYFETTLAEDPSLVVTTLDDVVYAFDYEISLREAIAYAAANPNLGSKITFAEGLSGTIDLADGELVIAQSLEIVGDDITINAGGASRAFNITGAATNVVSVELTGISVENGNAYGDDDATYVAGETFDANKESAYSGGAILVANANLTINDATFSDNTAYVGGAIFVSDGALNLSSVEFNGNLGKYQGGAVNVYASSDKTVQNPTENVWENVQFVDNESERGGGAYFRAGVLTVADGFFYNNTTTWANGGALAIVNSTAEINGAAFDGNMANRFGGAVMTSSSSVNISASTFTGNSAPNGGAVYSTSKSSVSYTNVEFTKNVAAVNGGAIYGGKGTTTVIASAFTGNNAGEGQQSEESGLGGAIYSVGETLEISEGSAFTSNEATNGGGAIFAATSTSATISGADFTKNSSAFGGAIRGARGSNLAVEISDFVGNVASGMGGAIYVGEAKSLNVEGGAFDGNTSVSSGGAIYVAQTTTSVAGATFANNSSTQKYGGAIFATNGNLTVGTDATNTAFNSNAAVAGGAIAVSAGSADRYALEVVGVEFTDNDATAKEGTGKGGAIFSQLVDVAIQSSNFEKNAAYNGGAVMINGASLTADDVAFDSNSTVGQGGAVAIYGVAVEDDAPIYEDDELPLTPTSGSSGATLKTSSFNNVSFRENTSARAGALYVTNANVEATLAIFASNTASLSSGGAATIVGGSVDFVNPTFYGNTSGRFGGALNLANTTATITTSYDTPVLVDATFESNKSQSGGAIYASRVDLTIDGALFANNAATNVEGKRKFDNKGGALTQAFGSLSLNAVNFANNSSDKSGGAIFLSQTESSSIQEATFTGNTAVADGGAIYTIGNDLELTDVEFAFNTSGATGGALKVSKGSLAVSGATFDGNTAATNGGAIALSTADSTISRASFTENVATAANSYGGALYLAGAATTNIDNSLIAKNDAYYGSALVANGAQNTVNLKNVTVADNTSAKPSIQIVRVMAGATVNLYNSIVVGEKVGFAVNGSLNAYNTLSPFTDWTDGDNPEYDETASLFAEGSYELAADSQALNAGDDSAVVGTLDLVGAARKVGTVDLGAYELQTGSDAALDEAIAELFIEDIDF